jgi:hypothetical protein
MHRRSGHPPNMHLCPRSGGLLIAYARVYSHLVL